jgi:glyoxylase-like metal-dependent hydrolase (beta-lactamase superfamily II)
VDPGSPWQDQQDLLDAELPPLALVVLTHHHGDHVGGAAAIAARRGVPIAAHPRTAERLVGSVSVTRLIHDGDTVDDSGVPMTAMFTPGHADGHHCFALPDGSALAGDMVASVGTIIIDPDEGDMILYLASLRRLLERPQGTLLPAHGPPITDGHGKLRQYVDHRLMREAKVVAALAAGAGTVDDLVPRAYADTPSSLWPLAARSLRAHLDKLVREARARVDGDIWSSLL